MSNLVPKKQLLDFLEPRPNFEALTSTGSEVFSFSSLDVIKYLQLLSFFSLIQTIFLKILRKNIA